MSLRMMALLLASAADAIGMSLDIVPARTAVPLRAVSPHYISFSLDSAMVRDPTGISGVVLPQDNGNSTRINFTNPLLNKIMPLVAGGYLRIGGTYTDFVHYYVPGSNHTKCTPVLVNRTCPGNVGGCCQPLTMERWTEALDATHRWGMQVVFNLNLLHGRFNDYSEKHYKSNGTIPPWDSSEARALMEYTAKNVAPEKWPASFGLGNELGSYVSPEQWATDNLIMRNLVHETFGKAKVAHPQAARLKGIFSGLSDASGQGATGAAGATVGSAGIIPSTYGPCNCMGSVPWSLEYLGNLTAMSSKTADGKNPIAAFSFHAYDHGGSTVAEVATISRAHGFHVDIDTERDMRFEPAAATWRAANTTTKLWITETAASVVLPDGHAQGGAKAAIDGMCRAADIAWYLDALGAAAEVGVDVFSRESLAGDWLEVLGLWQPGDARTDEANRPYTPHPDFWVAALWNKLMAVRVLGANNTNMTAATAAAAVVSDDTWMVKPGFSCNFGGAYNGSTNVTFYGKTNSSAECQAKCAASRQSTKPCKAFSWFGNIGSAGNKWTDTCYGRLDDVWALSPLGPAISGCDKSLHLEGKWAGCVATLPPAPPPAPPPALAVRTFAHCSKLKAGAVMFAVAVSPCVRTEIVDLRFPEAKMLTTWWLSGLSPSDDMISLNGANLTVSVDAPLPTLDGVGVPGDVTAVPATGVCTVGFVQAEYSEPVAACM